MKRPRQGAKQSLLYRLRRILKDGGAGFAVVMSQEELSAVDSSENGGDVNMGLNSGGLRTLA